MGKLKFVSFLLIVWMFIMGVSAGYSRSEPLRYAVSPVCEKIQGLSGEYRGYIAERLDAVTKGWLIPMPDAHPSMITMFNMRERNRTYIIPWTGKEAGDLLPWSGEFVGKHLLGAQLVYRMNRNPKLKASIDNLIRKVIEIQDKDGYLGPFSKSRRFDYTSTWDFWGHYHIIQSLLMYHEDTDWEPALETACKAADLISNILLYNKEILHEKTDNDQMNHVIVHAMTHLYLRTGEPQYLKTAQWLIDHWDRPNSLQYISLALKGKPIVEFPAHRFESAHNWQAIAEMYLITGDEKYFKAFSHIWRNALQGDRHNTGGWTSSEEIQNNPYHQGIIQTSGTVSWIALSIDMLRLTGNSMIADELELSTWNGMFGATHPSGRWSTYSTPMDGSRRGAIQDFRVNKKPGVYELNRCCLNAPRGIGMIQNWAVMREKNGIMLNWYGPSTFTVPFELGKTLVINQKTSYPNDGNITISIGIEEPLTTILKLRIPSWSAKTVVKLNGQNITGVKSGSYLELDRTWHNGDSIELSLDMSPHFWVGERECEGKTSIYTGPILLAWDQRFNEGELTDVPEIDTANLKLIPLIITDYPRPISVYRINSKDGKEIVLCDFATAGMTGTLYRSWLPVEGVKPFTAESGEPVWTAR